MSTDAHVVSPAAGGSVPTSRRRLVTLVLISIVLLFSAIRVETHEGHGSNEFHAILETLATMTVAFASSLAFLRYYARKNSPMLFLFLGTGLLGTCLFDGLNSIATSEIMGQLLSEDLRSLMTWSWSASRLLFAAMMLMCWFAARVEARHDELPVSEWMIYAGTGIVTLLMAALIAIVPPPRAYFSELWLPRPQDFLSGLVFLIVTLAFWRLGGWRRESIQFWILCSVLVSTVGQLIIMPRSSQMFDTAFNWAHILKVCSYLAVLMGLLIDIYRSHRDLDRTADRLRINEERFALAAEGSFNGMWDWEVETDHVWYAPRFWHLLGYASEPYPPNVVDSFNGHLHPDDYQATWAAVDRHLYQGDEVFDVEYRLRNLKHGYRWFRGRGVALRNQQGSPVRLSGSIQDITASKLAERQLTESAQALKRSNEELQRFASVASHDLQEPLRAIVGYCGLLKQHHADALDDEGQQFVQYSIDGAKRMQQLIDSLLDLSRLQTHIRPFAETDLNRIVETALNNLSLQIRETSADIRVGGLPNVVGDEVQLIQLFQNLLSNAIKFRKPDQQPHIRVEAQSNPTEWLMTIQDNGIGIPPAQGERIFTVFQRLHSRDEFDGTGIGLAICKKVVERHQGQIWIESTEGQGSTFRFTLSKSLTNSNKNEIKA